MLKTQYLIINSTKLKLRGVYGVLILDVKSSEMEIGISNIFKMDDFLIHLYIHFIYV